jgi:hypothetical protein
MGLYHYCMYVYGVGCSHPCEDFATYLFDDMHPACARQVQKLRVDESYRIPRLSGVSLPAMSKDVEVNAMVKTMLFRSLRPDRDKPFCEVNLLATISRWLDDEVRECSLITSS